MHTAHNIFRSDRPFLLHGCQEDPSLPAAVYLAASSCSSDSSLYTEDPGLEEAYSKGEAAQDDLTEHIYEEIPDSRHRVRPLPPIPEGALAKSIFTGATKYEILHYLADARQRIEGQGGEFDSCPEEGEGAVVEGLGSRGAKLRVSGRQEEMGKDKE